jgi:hypothetical protein
LRATLLAKCGEKFCSLGPYSRLKNIDVFFKIGPYHLQFGVNMVRGGVFYFTRFFSMRPTGLRKLGQSRCKVENGLAQLTLTSIHRST